MASFITGALKYAGDAAAAYLQPAPVPPQNAGEQENAARPGYQALTSYIPGYATVANVATSYFQEAPLTPENVCLDMQSPSVSDATIIQKIDELEKGVGLISTIYLDERSLLARQMSAATSTETGPVGRKTSLLEESLRNKRSSVAEHLIYKYCDYYDKWNNKCAVYDERTSIVANHIYDYIDLILKHKSFSLVAPLIQRVKTFNSDIKSVFNKAAASGADIATLNLILAKKMGGIEVEVDTIISALDNHELLRFLLEKNTDKKLLSGWDSKYLQRIPFDLEELKKNPYKYNLNIRLLALHGIDLISDLIEKKWFDVIPLLCKTGFRLSHLNHLALVKTGGVALVRGLIESGAFILNYTKEKTASTALLEAIRSRSMEMVQLLIEKGADIKERSNRGKLDKTTPFLEAYSQRNPDMIKLLHDKILDIKAPGAVELDPRSKAEVPYEELRAYAMSLQKLREAEVERLAIVETAEKA